MGRPKKDGTPARTNKACSVLVPIEGVDGYHRIDAPAGLKQAKEIVAGLPSLDGVEIVVKTKRVERTTKIRFV